MQWLLSGTVSNLLSPKFPENPKKGNEHKNRSRYFTLGGGFREREL